MVGVVADLVDQQVAGVQVLAGVVGAGVEAVVVEDVQGDLLLGQEVEQLGVQVHLAVQVEAVHVLDGDGLASRRPRSRCRACCARA